MRRGFSIFLIAWFGLGSFFAALDTSDDTGLPACCRRDGAHHCVDAIAMAAMARAADSESRSAVHAPLTCKSYPGMGAALLTRVHALTVQPGNFGVTRARASDPKAIRTAPPSDLVRVHAGRGPPALNLT